MGVWRGIKGDRGELPMGILLGFPGALVGGFVGCVVGAVVFS